jgi:hypothetical protein
MPEISAEFKLAAARLAEKLRDSPGSLPAFRRRVTTARAGAEAALEPPAAARPAAKNRSPENRQ